MSIITSLLDNDFYAFTMGQVVWREYRDVQVKYAFTNRTRSVPLARHIMAADLGREVEAVQKLRFTEAELSYLASLGCFDPEYLNWLRNLRLPDVHGWMTLDDNQLHLTYKGEWTAAIFWETMLLAIVNELYYRSLGLDGEIVVSEGRKRLSAKIEQLRQRPELHFVEFGTRRRFSRSWQREVAGVLQAELPGQLVGTSNVALARDLGLAPVGTMAHQLFMVVTARHMDQMVENPIESAQDEVLDYWEKTYGNWEGGKLLTFLPDTYGSPTFYRHLDPERLQRWRAVRQDSGDPVAEGERWLAYLSSVGCDPMDFHLVPSDGLTMAEMQRLTDHFAGRVGLNFGWGTNLTNDLGPAPLSMVIKPKSVDGQPCVKLSDNAAKAIGPAKIVANYRFLAQLDSSYRQDCTY